MIFVTAQAAAAAAEVPAVGGTFDGPLSIVGTLDLKLILFGRITHGAADVTVLRRADVAAVVALLGERGSGVK